MIVSTPGLRQTLRATLAAAISVLACAAILGADTPAVAAPATCTADDFARAVDEAGAELRRFNAENAPKLNAKLRELKRKKGWADDDEDMALDYLSDQRLTGFDSTANELLARIDTLGRADDGKTPDCSKLDDLKAAGLELVAVMKAKSVYMSAKIDAEGAAPGTAKRADAKPADTARPADPATAGTATDQAKTDPAKSAGTAKPADVTKEPPKVTQAQPAEPRPVPPVSPPPNAPKAAAPSGPIDKKDAAKAPPQPVPPQAMKSAAQPAPPPSAEPGTKPASGPAPWSTTFEQHAANDPTRPNGPAGAAAQPGAGRGGAPTQPGPDFVPPEEGYSIEEIRDATRGFFGTISTNLATVIEHTFSSLGRPTGYVLGSEGGGAFLAGLRYGSGMLYMRSGGGRPVHWHGPSLGYDFGAAGSRTLFLIYGLHDANQLYRAYTGIDGSAYVIGGVGVTFLKGGNVTMAPIRSGLGLRVGANIGYVRFTAEPSWNPF